MENKRKRYLKKNSVGTGNFSEHYSYLINVYKYINVMYV